MLLQSRLRVFSESTVCLLVFSTLLWVVHHQHHRHPRLSQSISHPPVFILSHTSIVLNDLYSRHRSYCRACSRRQTSQCCSFRNILRGSESRSHFQCRQCVIEKVSKDVGLFSRYSIHVN